MRRDGKWGVGRDEREGCAESGEEGEGVVGEETAIRRY
jgi:hypothetical protein